MKKVVVFGGAGFLGSELTKKLLESDYEVNVVCTNTSKAEQLLGKNDNLKLSSFDIFDKQKIQEIISDADSVINLIGKLYEVGKKNDFYNYHELFVKHLCDCLTEQHFIHISSLGVEKSSVSSKYAATKHNAELQIEKNVKRFNILKPSIIFGEQDKFFNMFNSYTKFSPFLPLIGDGKTLFSPVYVKDVAEAILKLMNGNNLNETFSACGPDTSSFRELLQFILKTRNINRILIPLPVKMATIQAMVMNKVGIYVLTPDQIKLLEFDNINSSHLPNIDKLIEKTQSYKDIVPKYLK